MRAERRRGHSIRVHPEDYLFVQAERVRLARHAFIETRELVRPPTADVLACLFEELRALRAEQDGGRHMDDDS